MPPVHEVHVVPVRHRGVATGLGVDVHVRAVRQMLLVSGLVAVGQLVNMVRTGRVHMPVMQVVDVILVRHRGMSAPLVVDMFVSVHRRVLRCVLA